MVQNNGIERGMVPNLFVCIICHSVVTNSAWCGGLRSRKRLVSHEMWFRKTATSKCIPPYPPRAISYHHTLSKLLLAWADTSKWCIGQEAMKMYGFLIPIKGAEGIHAAETLIINVVPVITTIWKVYIFTFVFKCVFGAIKSISLRTYPMPKDNVGETLCFLPELSVATSQLFYYIISLNHHLWQKTEKKVS